jgi:Polyketide cyclase / dehydrase and lipid transport
VPRPWFRTEPADETFFDTAPTQLRDTFELSRPASQVWDELTADDALSWVSILSDVEWTSPRPFGVGTTRTVSALRGLNVLKERFFRWEDGRRMSFYVTEASAPGFRRFAEDYLVEPTSEESCRFTWVVAIEPAPAGRLTMPVNRRLMGTLFRDTRRHYGLA